MNGKTLAVIAATGLLVSTLSMCARRAPAPSALHGELGPAADSSQPTAPAATASGALLMAGSGPAAPRNSQIVKGGALELEARLGYPEVLADTSSENYLLLNVQAPAPTASVARPKLNLAIVLDRSGSMRGKRLASAIEAASGMIGRLQDDDTLSLVTYNERAEVLVRPTRATPPARAQAQRALARLSAQGNTCISCGLETGQRLLDENIGGVARLLLLSDGEPTTGVREVEGFRAIAERMHAQGTAISSIGVDIEYNERTLAALAQASNGRHHFVEHPADLAGAFDAELASLVQTRAARAELVLELDPGVHLAEVYDRNFRRDAGRTVVPLGTFAVGDRKSVLVRVNVERAAAVGGERPLGRVRLRYVDLGSQEAPQLELKLSARATAEARELSGLDPLVAERLQRSETARALTDANRLYADGKAREAAHEVRQKLEQVRQRRSALQMVAPSGRTSELEREFKRQEQALAAASEGFATPPPPVAAAPAMRGSSGGPDTAAAPQAARKGKVQVKANQAEAADLVR